MSYDETIIKPDGSERTKEQIFNEIVDEVADQDLKVMVDGASISVTIDDFYEGSQNYFVTDTISEIIFKLEELLNEIDKNTRLSFTDDTALEEKGLENGLFIDSGEKATGEVTMTLPMVSNSDTVIPENTMVATDTIVSFQTLEDLIIEAGLQNGIVPVECDVEGIEGNIPARSITTILDDLPQTITVTNENPMTGGRDPESDDDFRQRIIDNNSPPGSKGYYELVLKTKFKDATAFIETDETVNCWIHPYENQENPIQTAINLFKEDEYATTDNIIINPLKPVEAFTAGSRKLFIRYHPDGTVSTKDLYNEFMKKITNYVNRQPISTGIITLSCIKFLIESTQGVQYFDIVSSSYKGFNNGEHKLNVGEYFVFNNASMITIEEI